MSTSFVTFLGTDNFLPGIIALDKSIKLYNKNHPLLVMVANTVSDKAIALLHKYAIKTKLIEEIPNPHSLGNDERSYRYTFTKLRMFDLTEFKKIVYIDADMLVCKNIEELFNKPHMSAVIAGSIHPHNHAWKDLNSGLMIIEPDKELFKSIVNAINTFPSLDGSDQGFLHSFFKDWPQQVELHLGHKYNVPYLYLDEYCKRPDFDFEYKRKLLKTNVSIIHYWDKYKPWNFDSKSLKRRSDDRLEQSLILWWDILNS